MLVYCTLFLLLIIICLLPLWRRRKVRWVFGHFYKWYTLYTTLQHGSFPGFSAITRAVTGWNASLRSSGNDCVFYRLCYCYITRASAFCVSLQRNNGAENLWSREKRLQEMPFFPRSSYWRPMLQEDGGPNRDFLTYLFCDRVIAMQFLMDVGLLRSKVQCNTCGRDMTWSVQPSIPKGFRWWCPKKVAGVKCSESRSITHGSWCSVPWSTAPAPRLNPPVVHDHLLLQVLNTDHL